MTGLKQALNEINTWIAAGETARAAERLDALAADHPEHSTLLLTRVRLAQAMGDGAAALAHAAHAYRADPDRAGCYLAYARALEAQGRRADAEAVLSRAVKAQPDNAEPLVLLADWAAAAGDTARALARYTRAIARAPEHRKARHRQLALLLAAGRLKEVATGLESFAIRFPDAPEGYRMSAQLARAEGDLARAVACSAKALERTGDARSAADHAGLLMEIGDHHAALNLLDSPDYAETRDRGVLLRKAALQERSGRPATALAAVERVLEDRPGDLQAGQARARLLMRLGQSGEAEAALRQLAGTAPPAEAAAAARQLAGLLQSGGASQTALEVLQAARTRAPGDRTLAAWTARALCDLGQRDAALAMAGELAAAGADAPAEALELARLYAHLKRPEREFAVLKAALAGLETQGAAGPAAARLVDYFARRVMGHAALSEIEPRLAALEARFGLTLPEASWAQLYLQHADPSAARAYLGASRRGRRSEAQARDMARLLIAEQRIGLARRYLRYCRRAWPGSAQFAILQLDLYLRFGWLDEAAEVLQDSVATTPEMTARFDEYRALLQLYESPGARLVLPDDAAELAGQTQAALERFLRNTIAEADLARAEVLRSALMARHRERAALHWRSSFEGQLLSEMQLLAADLGADWPGGGLWAEDAQLAAETRARPWSTVLAAAQIRRATGGAPGLSVPPRDQKTGSIPAEIIQYWNDPVPPGMVAGFVQSWAAVPGWGHALYNRGTAMGFLREEFGADWLRAFRMARRPAEEADFFRLCWLARRGGVWADADDRLYGRLGGLVRGDEGLVVIREPVGGAIANNFIAAAPGHPVITKAAEWVCEAFLQRSNETVWLKCGPGLLTRAVGQALAAEENPGAAGGITILGQEHLRREVSIHNRLPHKSTDSYWNRKRAQDPGYVALIDRLVAEG